LEKKGMAKFTLSLDGPLNKIPEDLRSNSFDYVSRYQLIGEIITRYEKATGRKPKNILDVGGRGSFLDRLIDIPITILDSEAEESKGDTRGDGARMDIADGAYDIVITSDTLEHIPRSDRKAFVNELFRVSNDLVILCAPFDDHGAAAQEALVQDFYRAFMGHPHRWLQEHADFKIPNEAATVKQFEKLSRSTVAVRHSDVKLWRQLLTVSLVANDMGGEALTKVAADINRYYNEHLLFKDFTDASYRTYIVGSKKHDLRYTPAKETINLEDMAVLNGLLADFMTAIFGHKEQIPSVRAELDANQNKITALQNKLKDMTDRYNHVVLSRTWRYTEPPRKVVRGVGKIAKRIQRSN
jgi:hypothetical protein